MDTEMEDALNGDIDRLRKNKERATRQTERHYLNQVLLQQLTPQLRQTVLRRKFDLDGFLN